MATDRRQVDPHAVGNSLRSHSSKIAVRMFRIVTSTGQDPSAFRRAFQRGTGGSPRAYRRAAG
jgi:hypothetical protein